MELKTIKSKRKAYIRRGWILFIAFPFGLPALGIILTVLLPKEAYDGTFLGIILSSFIASFMITFWVFGGFLIGCYGRSGAQNLMLYGDELVYSIYTGSFDNRETNIFRVKKIKEYTVTSRNIFIKGDFEKTNVSRFGELGGEAHKIKLARVFDNEDKLIAFLDSHKE